MQKRFLVGALVALYALGLGAAPVSAGGGGGSFNCNKTVNGGTILSNVNVNPNGVCILNGVTVTGNVTAGRNSYFESNGSTIAGNVTGGSSLTLYIWGGSKVGGNVAGINTAQVFVYDSTVGKNVAAFGSVAPGYGHFQVCGSTVTREIGVAFMGPDILIGDPAAGCGANTAKNGDIVVAANSAASEVYVIGNTATNGNIGVYNNGGAGDKRVNGNNAPKGDLFCSGNSAPFDGSANGTVGDVEGGQCTATSITGIDPDE